jgi:hypothetical protein
MDLSLVVSEYRVVVPQVTGTTVTYKVTLVNPQDKTILFDFPSNLSSLLTTTADPDACAASSSHPLTSAPVRLRDTARITRSHTDPDQRRGPTLSFAGPGPLHLRQTHYRQPCVGAWGPCRFLTAAPSSSMPLRPHRRSEAKLRGP